MEVLAIINQKGGIGKTTTAEALTAGLTLKGYKVLAIDLDAQMNFSRTAAAEHDSPTALDVLTGEATAADAIQPGSFCEIITGDRNINRLEKMIQDTGKEYRLQEALAPIKKQYDYIVIDTPPALSLLTINALTACTGVIIPAEADIYALEGITALADTIATIKKYTNPALKIKGILLTKYSDRTILSRDLAKAAEQVAAKLKTKLFKATIRNAVAIKEAQVMKRSIFDYAPKSKVAADYMAFIDELLEGGKTK